MGVLNLTELDQIPLTQGGTRCRVAVICDSHPDEADAIRQAINDRTDIPSSVVSRWLERHDIHISVSSIRRHRRHECGCHQ